MSKTNKTRRTQALIAATFGDAPFGDAEVLFKPHAWSFSLVRLLLPLLVAFDRVNETRESAGILAIPVPLRQSDESVESFIDRVKDELSVAAIVTADDVGGSPLKLRTGWRLKREELPRRKFDESDVEYGQRLHAEIERRDLVAADVYALLPFEGTDAQREATAALRRPILYPTWMK